MRNLAAALTVHLLGPFQLLVRGEPAPPLRSRQAQALLAWLILANGRERDRAHCAEQLWPDSRADQALANLRQNLASLRSALGPEACRLRTPDRRSLSFDVSDAAIDVLEFDRLAGSGDPAQWRQAVELYRGPLLPGVTAEAIAAERNHRQQRLEAILERLVELPGPSSETYAKELLRYDPGNESAIRNLVEIRARRGDSTGVVRLYEEFRRTLRRLYGTCPSAGLAEAYEIALAQSRQGSRPKPCAWTPAFLSPIVGRTAEITNLRGALRQSRCVTVVGPGGIGKTRLAAATVAEMNGIWIDGADLAPGETDASLEEAIRSKLGVASSETPLEALLSTRATGGPLLLVLDRVERSAAAMVGRLSRIAGLSFLCTSREPMGMGGEATFRLAGLSEEEALSLLESLVGESSATDEKARGELVRALEGFPMAIEIAAPLVKSMPVADLVEAVRRKGVLSLEQSGEGKLRGTMELSWAKLGEVEHTLLRAAAAMPGPFGVAELLAIAEAEGGETVLGSLVLKSWVLHNPDTRFTPFRLSNVVRDFVREKDLSSWRSAFVTIYAELAERCRRESHVRGGQDRRAELAAHLVNLLYAMRWSLEDGLGEPAHRLAGSLWAHLFSLGRVSEAREYVDRCLELTTPCIEDRTRVLNAAGFIARHFGELARCVELHRTGLQLAEAHDAQASRAESHARLALGLKDFGEPAAAKQEYRAALHLFQMLGDKWWQASALHELATIHIAEGDDAGAERLLSRAQPLMKETGDEVGWAAILETRAESLAGRGQFDAARDLLTSARDVYDRVGFIRNQIQSDIRLAHLASLEGRANESIALYSSALKASDEMGLMPLAVLARLRLGWLMVRQRDFAAAELLFQPVYACAVRVQVLPRAAEAQEGLAACFASEGQRDLALDCLAQAWRLRKSEEPPAEVQAVIQEFFDSEAILDQVRLRLAATPS